MRTKRQATLGLVALLCAGCATVGLHFHVKNPAFGSLEVNVDRGVIGRPGCVPTNAPDTNIFTASGPSGVVIGPAGN